MSETQIAPPNFPALVARVIDGKRLAINRGSSHGVKAGQRFLVYSIEADEIKDPSTGESLGRLEVVKGTGVASHVQEKMATIQSDIKQRGGQRIVKRKPSIAAAWSIFLEEEVVTIPPDQETVDFDGAKVGDYAKPI